jgi:hypothetical protein
MCFYNNVMQLIKSTKMKKATPKNGFFKLTIKYY